MTSLRIDTAIGTSSYLRLLLYVALTSVLILLAWSANLSLWQYGLLITVTALVGSYLALSRPILLHLSQPPLSQPLNQGWQLLMRTGHGDKLWQADLVKVYRYQAIIHFSFQLVEPYRKPWAVTVYRDQMIKEQWQQLNILATVTYVQT